MRDNFLYRTLCLLLVCFIASPSIAQKTELRVNAYSGLFYFRGDAATDMSTIYITDMGYYSATTYGRKSDFSYAFELQLQRVTVGNHFYGAGLGFEHLQSRAEVDS